MNTTNSIIPVSSGADGIQTVNARDLHAFLESGQEFRHWIKSRIEQYGFVDGQDFTTSENFIRGGKAVDYHITLDMAKELSMVERNAKGKEARQYFIECERVAAAPKPPVVRDARTAALIESLVRFDALEQEQIRMREEQEALRSKTQEVADRLDQIETAQNHFTVVGYASVYGHGSLALTHSSRVGKAASKYCKANSIEMGEVPDPRFGKVKTYPKWVLDIVFAEECEMA